VRSRKQTWKETDYKWWGSALEDFCREKTHRGEPPLVALLVPLLL